MNAGGFNGGVDVDMIVDMVRRSQDWLPENESFHRERIKKLLAG